MHLAAVGMLWRQPTFRVEESGSIPIQRAVVHAVKQQIDEGSLWYTVRSNTCCPVRYPIGSQKKNPVCIHAYLRFVSRLNLSRVFGHA